MDLRTPLSRVRGLGSAKEGTDHFWRQRLTSVANIPLILFFVLFIMIYQGASYETVAGALGNPLIAVLMGLAVLSGADPYAPRHAGHYRRLRAWRRRQDRPAHAQQLFYNRRRRPAAVCGFETRIWRLIPRWRTRRKRLTSSPSTSSTLWWSAQAGPVCARHSVWRSRAFAPPALQRFSRRAPTQLPRRAALPQACRT